MVKEKIGVIGAGMLGLCLAHELGKENDITLFEKEKVVGGIARPFKFQGDFFDRYYHFIFLNDHYTLNLMQDLDLQKKVFWGRPEMALLINDTFHPFSTPSDLLKSPLFSLVDKVRFAFATKIIGFKKNWKPLEKENGLLWFEKLYGKNVTNILWKPLMKKKFRSFYDKINAAWSWNEIFRRGKSRKTFGKEKLGCYKGSVKTLIDGLEASVNRSGGKTLVKQKITKVFSRGKKIVVCANGKEHLFDKVFSTIPSVLLNKTLPENKQIPQTKIDYLDVRCASFILKKPLSKYFWVNVNEESQPQVVIVEFSRLLAQKHTVVYLPYYAERGNKLLTMSDAAFKKMNVDYLRTVFPKFKTSDVLHYESVSDLFAQPVFDKNYSQKITSYNTKVPGLYNTNQSQIYPERSGINECARFAAHIAHDYKKGLKKYYFTAE